MLEDTRSRSTASFLNGVDDSTPASISVLDATAAAAEVSFPMPKEAGLSLWRKRAMFGAAASASTSSKTRLAEVDADATAEAAAAPVAATAEGVAARPVVVTF